MAQHGDGHRLEILRHNIVSAAYQGQALGGPGKGKRSSGAYAGGRAALDRAAALPGLLNKRYNVIFQIVMDKDFSACKLQLPDILAGTYRADL